MELRLDRYDVLHLLGTGGMAEVYLARHRELGTLHAVKWIKDRDPRRFGRLRTEGELQRSLRHPNVVGVSEVVASVDGDPVLVMDHVDGPSLADLLGVKIPLTIGEIDALATGILAGVAAAHARDWVHRDLKPSNVLLARVDDRLVARVADFGLARALGPDGAAEAGSTTRRGLGTQRYMPLEQLVGAPADKRMDVFALGAVLYELVHGHAAFPTVPAWEQSIRAELVPPMTRPDAPERFGRAVAAALGPRDRRPVDAAALAELWWGEPSAKPAAHAPFRPELVALAAVIGAHVPPERRSASTRTPADARHLSLCARCRRDADRPTATPAPSTLASMDPGSRGPGSPSASAGPAVVVAIADRDPPEVHPFVRSEDAIRLARAAGAGAGAHPDPHLARLLAAIARPGQVLTTSDALPSLGDPASSSFGRWRLGGSARHVELVALIARDGDPLEHPPDDGPAGWRIVPRDGGWGPARAVEHRLPPEVDRFVEREAELVALAARLQRERWVTLHGPAGVGKTRLAVRYGWGWLGAWSGGVWFCDLADAHGVEDLTLSVARALGVPLGDGSPVEQLGHALAARGRCLVILDNVEQLDPSTDAALDAWRAATVDAAFLVTSRVARGPHADGVVPLEPLADDAGVALFVERAAAVRRDFDPGHEPDAIRALVARLDGLPLAIELCAARVRTMRPGQILERLDQRFRLLAGDDGRPARHETLRAALDWSWDLLREGERSALVQLTAFDGGFTLEAAEGVVAVDGSWVADLVQALVDRALVRRIDDDRFGLLVSVHLYAIDQGRAGERAAAEVRHGAWFARFGTDEALDAHRNDVAGRRRVAPELANLIAASRRAVVRDAREVAASTALAAWEVLRFTGPFAVGSALLAAVVDGSDRLRVTYEAAVARLRCGDPAGATALAERALTAAGSAADRRVEGRALDLLGSIDQQQGRSDLSRAYFERALAVHRAAGDRAGEGDALSNLGAWFAEQGRLDEARDRFVEALAVGDRQTEAFTLGRLANVLSVRDPTAARGYYDRSLALHREAGDRRLEGGVLGALGTLHRDAGRVDEARACYELGLRIQATLGLPQDPQILCGLGNLDLNQGRLDDAHDRFTRAVASAIALGRTAFEAVARINLGMALNELGRRDEAIAQYERALALHRARGDRRNEATTQMNLGIVLLDRTRMEEALALYRALGDPKFEALALCNLGELHLLQGRLGEAREVLVDANALARAHASKRFDALSSGLLGGLCAAEHRYDEARDWFDRAAQALRELGNPVELGRVLIRAASAAVSAGDLRTAEAALREAASLGDRVAGPGSEVGQGIAEVRSRIVPSRP